jgi:DNA-binding LacI/PurR family transcriptional regulator
MARSMLCMTARELARRSGLSVTTVTKVDRADGIPAVEARTLHRIHAALEHAGAEFGRDGVTVRLRRGQP